MNWIYFYVIPLIICWATIYIIFRNKTSKDKRNLYELCRGYGFFLWMSILPAANIIIIISYILMRIGDLFKDKFREITEKIKI